MRLGDLIRTPLPDCTTNHDQSFYQGGPFGIPPGSPPSGVPPWNRSQIIPDYALPSVLRRIQPAPDVWRPNRFDAEIHGEAELWNYVASHGGIETCCRIPELGAPIWSQPPWQVMPSQGKELNLFFALPTNQVSGGGPFNGTDTILGQYRMPIGWDGVVSKVVFGFTGNGFDDFSGNIIWRLQVGKRFVKNLGNVLNTFGSLQTALLVPGRATAQVISGQTITLLANIPNGSPVAGGAVTGAILGWEYPRR